MGHRSYKLKDMNIDRTLPNNSMKKSQNVVIMSHSKQAPKTGLVTIS